MREKLSRLLHLTLIGLLILLVLYLIFKITLPFLPDDFQKVLNNISFNNFKPHALYLKDFIISYEPYSYLAFIGLQTIQVIFAPIPGQITGILGGFVFGFGEGLLYTMIGLLLGSFIAMLLGRTIGINLLNKLLSKKLVEKYDYLRSEKSLNTFFIIFLLPYFPDDAICFVAGMTRIKLWKLMLVCFIGRLPGMTVFSYMGSSIEENTQWALIIFILAIILSTFYWLFDQDIKQFLKRKSIIK